MEKEYLQILVESLEKKIQILKEISEINGHQKELLSEPEMNWDSFEDAVRRKEDLIAQIAFVDEGFQQMYQRLQNILQTKKEAYTTEITLLQEKIRTITELTVLVQAEEQTNKQLALSCFGKEKKKVRQIKNKNSVASKYYKSMVKLNVVEPQFMDKKN